MSMIKNFYIVQINNGMKSPALYTIPDVGTWLEENWDGKRRVKISVGERNIESQLLALANEEQAIAKRLSFMEQEKKHLESLKNGSGQETQDG